jgi:hypothetical protein
MSNKSEILSSILDSLSEDEVGTIEKTATDANALSNTENPEARKKVPSQSPTKKEGKLGLGVLKNNTYEEDVKDFNHVSPNGQDGQGTENISPKKTPVEPGVMFEKKASADVLNALYDAAGVDLRKVASEETQEDLLVKVAAETLEELKDLEKIAEEIADKITDKIMSNLEQVQ